ncbi:hypothetical protein NST83_01485 [Paenibacillus sp. FSL R10-2782]
MAKLLLAFERELLIVEKHEYDWKVSTFFKGANPISLAVDPHQHLLRHL